MKVKVNYCIKNNIYYKQSPEMFNRLIQLIEEYPCSYGQMLRAKGKKRFVEKHPEYIPPYKDLYDWINDVVPLLNDSQYYISTKCYWILNGLTDFPTCASKGCNNKFIKKNVQANGSYPKFCHTHCKRDSSTIEKRKTSCKKKFGVEFPSQSNEIKEKVRQTNLKNLGYSSPLACPKCREQGKLTRYLEHGDENWHNSEKASQTFKQHKENDPNFISNIRKKTKQTNINNGHCENWTNREKAIQTRLDNHNGIYWTDDMTKKSNATQNMHRQMNPNYDNEIKQKRMQTNIDHYGVPCVFQAPCIKEKLHQWIIDHGGETNVFQTEYVKNKSKQTMQKNYGVDYSMQSDEIKSKYDFKAINSKGNATKRRNGTFNSSKPEEESYALLCEKFKEENVIRQYYSDAYPFNCDFYIKPLGLYIECNYSWTHGGHFFDPLDENDQLKLKKWQSKETQYYQNAIETWTIRDVSKAKVAYESNLHYLVFWKLQELKSWLLLLQFDMKANDE